jgi:acetyl esterase/lipase
MDARKTCSRKQIFSIARFTVSRTTYIDSQEVMVEALRALGSEVKYAEYEGVGHNSWENVAIRATLG